MDYKFGEVVYDPTDSRCGQMLGKVVVASNIAKSISRTPSWCTVGVLEEVNQSDVDRPFLIKSSSGEFKYTFIREILKQE